MKNDFELTSFFYPFIRVAIIEDHVIVAEGFERIINASENVRVVAKAYNVAGCHKLLEVAKPDVVLLDISLPDGNGIDICPKIKEKYPQLKVIMLTSFGEQSVISRALNIGVDGYMVKSCSPEELIEGICTVASGNRFLCEEVSATIGKSEQTQLILSRRELELLQLIADGNTFTEQVEKMNLSANTIRNYHQKLNIKLEAHNTIQLIQNAKELNLL